MRSIVAVFAIVLATAGVTSAQAQQPNRYSMADLTQLGNDGSWDELLQHANDIAPSARNDAWRALVTRAASAVLDNVSDYEAFGNAESLTRSYGFLLQNAEFRTKRTQVAARAIERCLHDSYDVNPCLEAADQVSRRDPQNHELAFRLGQVIRLGTTRGTDTTFFRRAVEAQGAPVARYCGDGELQYGVTRRFSQVSEASEAADASAIAFGPCFAQVREALVTGLSDGSSTYKQIVCPGLIQRNAVSGAQRAACQDAVRGAQ